MPVTNVTSNQAYQLPNPANDLDYDVGRIISAINGIDANVATLFASLSGKAATSHSHAIADVSGLQAALDGKIGTGSNLPQSQVTNLVTDLAAKADLAGATFLGTVTGVNPSLGANNTQFATTSWVRSQGFLTAVVTANIGDSQVTSAKIAANAVAAGKLADGAVDTTARLADSIVTFAKMAAAAISSAAEFLSNTASKILTPAAVWSAAAPVAITDSASLTVDMATFINATVAKTTNGALENPTAPKPGQAGFILFTQDAAGDKTQTYGSYWKNVGSKTTLQTGNGKKTRLDYSVVSATEIHYSLSWVP